MPHEIPICDAFLSGFLSEDKDPHALTPIAVELVPTLGALSPRGGPVQDPAHTPFQVGAALPHRYLAHKLTPTPLGPPWDPPRTLL